MAKIDKTAFSSSAGNTPAYPQHCFAITPSDTDFYDPPITVYVGGAGNVAIVPGRGDRVTATTFTGLVAGGRVPCTAYKVMSTNTTATLLVGVV
jgi:hypothetical protein